MTNKHTRRNVLKASALVASAAVVGHASSHDKASEDARPTLKLGLMTYTLAKDWDIETIIKNCTETKFEHVELRTTHAHRVEVTLTKDQRQAVRKRFEGRGYQAEPGQCL